MPEIEEVEDAVAEAVVADVVQEKEPEKVREVKKQPGLLCSSCRRFMDRATDYSKGQLKKKGKRKCHQCIADATRQPKGVAGVISNWNDTKGAATVKTVLADEIEKAQKTGGAATIPGQDKYDVLLSWLRDGGADFSQLDLKYYTVDYRGVHAKSRLERGRIILKVPLPLILTSDVAKASVIGRRIVSSGCELRSDHSWLACFLLQEKFRPDSKFAPYINTLPQHYRNMPIFFDDSELKELKGSFTTKMISDRKIGLKIEYDNICSHMPEFAKFHLHEFFWARLAVITRIFGFEVGSHRTDGLVAMADMLNHKRPNETTWHFDNALNSFTITTTKRLLKGGQIFDSYGRKCNSRYFVNYGFSLDSNEDNQVAVFFQLPKPRADADENGTVAYQLKAKYVGDHVHRYQIAFEHKEKCTRKCLSYLRVAVANLEELVAISKLQSVLKIDPISIQNEVRVMRALADQAKLVLAGFATTLEEDNRILAEEKLTMNVRACVLMRRGEKEVLHAFIDLDETIQAVKDMDLRQLKKYLARNVNNVGAEPSIPWRKEMYFSEFWIPLLTGVKVKVQEMNNSLE